MFGEIRKSIILIDDILSESKSVRIKLSYDLFYVEPVDNFWLSFSLGFGLGFGLGFMLNGFGLGFGLGFMLNGFGLGFGWLDWFSLTGHVRLSVLGLVFFLGFFFGFGFDLCLWHV